MRHKISLNVTNEYPNQSIGFPRSALVLYIPYPAVPDIHHVISKGHIDLLRVQVPDSSKSFNMD